MGVISFMNYYEKYYQLISDSISQKKDPYFHYEDHHILPVSIFP